MDKIKKEIVIFDTNFVIRVKESFWDIVKKLQTEVDVYLSEMVLQERLSQKWRELKDKFDEIEKIKSKYIDLIS